MPSHLLLSGVEALFLPSDYERQPDREYVQFADLGVDGIFSDFPDVTVRALRARAASGPGPR